MLPHPPAQAFNIPFVTGRSVHQRCSEELDVVSSFKHRDKGALLLRASHLSMGNIISTLEFSLLTYSSTTFDQGSTCSKIGPRIFCLLPSLVSLTLVGKYMWGCGLYASTHAHKQTTEDLVMEPRSLHLL